MSSERIVADPNMPVLADADLDGLYLAALEPYPYLMTPTQVAELACGTPGGVRHLLKMGGEIKGARMGSRWVVPIEISGIALFFPIRCRYDR